MNTITIEMLTDWHIGSGTGRSGNIDRLVKRDYEQFPFIPAKTLTGIWRDACEKVALGLDEGDSNGIWHKWVNYLFGDQPALESRKGNISENPPQGAILSVRPAHLPISLKNALRSKPLLKAALTFIKPGVAIDPYSGCAKSDFLRFEEMVRSGTKLTAIYTLEGLRNSDDYKTAQALLAAGASIVERLGAKRRRGSGRCKITVGYQLEDAITWIENHRHPELPNNSPLESKPLVSIGNWHRIQLILEAKTPLLIHHKTVGNVVETLDYIPGTFLLSILSNKLKKLGIDIGEAIAQENIIVTNATPEIAQKAGRPIPLCLFYKKSEKDKKDKLAENRLKKAAESGSQFKGYRTGYVSHGIDSVVLGTVAKCVETHNTVNDEVQRPNEDVGGVYSYEVIAPGTRFRAELRLRENLVDIIQDSDWELLAGDHQIGRTKKDDYGLISFKIDHATPLDHETLANSVSLNNQELTVWLLSDVLIRNKQLRPTADIDDFAEVLGEKLGVNLKIRSEELKSNEIMHFMARQNRTDSWQTRWGLPRPSLVGLSAGTCIILQADKSLDAKVLSDLEMSGIGERKAEGYGQICFNDPILNEEKITIHKQSQTNDNLKEVPPLINKQDEIFNYARIIEKEAWREAIRKASLLLSDTRDSRQEVMGLVITGEPGILKIESHPSMSQLGNLRSALKRLQQGTDETRDATINWLETLTSQRGNKWPDGSLEKIKGLISELHRIWNLMICSWQDLDIDINQMTLTITDELKAELWGEAVRILIDACIRAHKRDLEKQMEISQEVANGTSN